MQTAFTGGPGGVLVGLYCRQHSLPELHWLESSQSSSLLADVGQVLPVEQTFEDEVVSVGVGASMQHAVPPAQIRGRPPGVGPHARTVAAALVTGLQLGSTCTAGA